MSDTVRLSSKLSKDEETNGLDSLQGDLLQNKNQVVCAIVWLTVDTITEHTATGERVPRVEVKRIEPIATVDKVPDAIIELAARLYEQRTGRAPLPFEVVETIEGGYVHPDED